MNHKMPSLYQNFVYGPVPVVMRHPHSRQLQPFDFNEVFFYKNDIGKYAMSILTPENNGQCMLAQTYFSLPRRADGAEIVTMLEDQLMLFPTLEAAQQHRRDAGLTDKHVTVYQVAEWAPPEFNGVLASGAIGLALEITQELPPEAISKNVLFDLPPGALH